MLFVNVNNLLLNALIVDDELDICYLLSGILRQRNFKTSYVTTLSEAAEAMKKEIPSVLFLDNHLPDGRGMDFIPWAKELNPDIKIIMITAHDSIEDRRRAYEEGVDYFIAKPFTKNLIGAAIDQIA